jgi:hypothetical protein
MKICSLLLLSALTVLHAEPLAIYPSSDNRILDIENNGRGNESRMEDHTGEALNIGDNPQNSVWRSVMKFDLRPYESRLAREERITLQLTVRQRLIQTPREWTFQIVHFPSDQADSIQISPAQGPDDFSAEGRLIHEQPAGTVRDGMQLRIDVTEAVRTALNHSGILALRLQLDPATNNDNAQDQISFFAGSHNVNTPSLRPQLITGSGE